MEKVGKREETQSKVSDRHVHVGAWLLGLAANRQIHLQPFNAIKKFQLISLITNTPSISGPNSGSGDLLMMNRRR